jgi:uncharacterized protein (TIGR00369 family)
MEITAELIEQVSDNSLYGSIGLVIDEANGGRARSTLRPNPDLCWPFPGQPHGGVLFTQMDTTMAWAVISAVEADRNCVTIDLSIQYPAAAKGEFFICQAWVVHRTSRLIYLRADVTDPGGRMVATGQGTFRVVNAPLKPNPRREF